MHSLDVEAREGPTADQVIEWEQSPRSQVQYRLSSSWPLSSAQELR